MMDISKSIDFKLMVVASLAAALVVFTHTQTSTVFAQSSKENTKTVPAKVSAGGNGSDWDKFGPQTITINAGESVTWIIPCQCQNLTL